MVDEGEFGSVGSRVVFLDVLVVIESVYRSFFKNIDDGEELDVCKLFIYFDCVDLSLSGVKFMMSGVTTLGDRRFECYFL